MCFGFKLNGSKEGELEGNKGEQEWKHGRSYKGVEERKKVDGTSAVMLLPGHCTCVNSR